ncbi:PIG-L deacetylase family protein [Kangiella sp. TOML190]|uniref:PIG-L deacetylase family protein n=1 Tax=Kangiella sp. TOML190 TaxID=2931351 RepID=UPI00203B04A5|nr:PIG-L deacetylase family protein [Kangiella sp. TOML190]
MKVTNLVVVAHPDDEILGFGATGAKLVEQGESVLPVILCGNVDLRQHRPNDEQLYNDIIKANKEVGFKEPVLGGFPNIRMNTTPHIELVQFIEEQILKYNPTRVFTHHPSDINDDHKQVAHATMAAARLFQRRSDVNALDSMYFMEILSSTDWSFPYDSNGFTPNTFSEVEHYLERKIKALSHYRNVMRKFPHPRSEEVLKGLAAYRGGQSGQLYSEAFQLVFKRDI